uniref:EamA-like transporter family protein n=1 Tax=Candidatus Kentrum sp. LFY TaxID=2126342 RepID=A0A450WSB5_9GAMM|nr:MAG: hypothetical protein BECKLFY1418C_GA0070996_106516 [Candidatus Kentron sp. LFY]
MNNIKKMKYLFADIILTIGVCIMFGSGLAAIKASFYGFGVFTAVALRFFVASVTIFLWIKVTRKSIRIESERFLKIFIWTGIFLVEYFLLFFGVSKIGIVLLGEVWTVNIFSASILIILGLFMVHYPGRPKIVNGDS